MMINKTLKTVYDGNSLSHGCWDLILNLSGSGVMTANKQLYHFEEGTLFCVPPGVVHSKFSEGGYLDIHIFNKTFLAEYNDGEVLVFQDDELKTVYNLFMQMEGLYLNPTTARGQLLEGLYQVLTTWVSLQRNAHTRHLPVQEIATKLEQNFTDPAFMISPLLQGYNYCPDFIRSLFKRHYGMSPSEYLTDLRLKHAKKLLGSYHINSYTILHIAIASGFTDQNYFSRVFKKHYKITPLQYAKRIAEKK